MAWTLHIFLALCCSCRQRKVGILGRWRGDAKAENGHWPQSQRRAMNRSVECAQAHTHLFGPKTSILSKICKNRERDPKRRRNGSIPACQNADRKSTRLNSSHT